MNEISARRHAEVPYPIGPGTAADMAQDQEIPELDLLTPLSLRQITLRNRIVVSPCVCAARAKAWRMTGISCIWAAEL